MFSIFNFVCLLMRNLFHFFFFQNPFKGPVSSFCILKGIKSWSWGSVVVVLVGREKYRYKFDYKMENKIRVLHLFVLPVLVGGLILLSWLHFFFAEILRPGIYFTTAQPTQHWIQLILPHSLRMATLSHQGNGGFISVLAPGAMMAGSGCFDRTMNSFWRIFTRKEL